MGKITEAILNAKELLDSQNVPEQGRQLWMTEKMYKALEAEVGLELNNRYLGYTVVIK